MTLRSFLRKRWSWFQTLSFKAKETTTWETRNVFIIIRYISTIKLLIYKE